MLVRLQALAEKGPSMSPTELAESKTLALNAQNIMRQAEGQGTFREGTAKFDAKMIPDNVNDWIPWHTKSSFQKQISMTLQGLESQEKGLLSAHVMNYQPPASAQGAVPFRGVGAKKAGGNG